MQARVLLRTHYQANEPRLIIAAVTRCSSPTESRHEEVVASTLEKWARNNGYAISTPGAIYAVGNARHLGLLSDRYSWTASGLAFAFLDRFLPSQSGINSRVLTSVEDRLYLKTYLTGAGALLIKFAEWLVQRGSVTDEELRSDSVFEKLMTEIFEEYLSLATDVRERTALRNEKERLSRTEYAASTKRHKRYPLLTTMERLRLLTHNDDGSGLDVIRPDTEGRLEALSRALPDVETLEQVIRVEKLQETLDLALREYDRHDLPNAETPAELLAHAYAFAIDKGMQACPLVFLDDVLSSVFPTAPERPTPRAQQILDPVQRAQPGEVRFHVNRRGQRAFVLLGKAALASLTTR